jgi:hypothetical protein
MAEDAEARKARLRERVLELLRAKDVEAEAAASAELAAALAQFEASVEEALNAMLTENPELLDEATEDEVAQAVAELFEETFGPVS